MKKHQSKLLRIPVHIVEGQIVPQDGLYIPFVEGAEGELIIEQDTIVDPALAHAYSKKNIIKLLPEGTDLLVMMSDPKGLALAQDIRLIGEPEATIRPRLGKWFSDARLPSFPRFIPVRLGPLLPWQESPDGDGGGGLWLELEGMRCTGLISSSIEIPKEVKFTDHVTSLNHAFTVLSEVFEPHRQSHTGNAYQKVLYRDAGGRWYPIDLFRRGGQADARYEIARSAWLRLLDEMKPSQANS